MAGSVVERDPVVATEGGVRLRLHARRLRGDRALKDIAQRAGVNRDDLSKFERGETTQVRFATLVKLLKVYGCALEDLIEVERVPVLTPAPLYAGALAAISSGLLPGGSPGRRAVIRQVALDVASPVEEQRWVTSADASTQASVQGEAVHGVGSTGRRRRSPVGTARG